MAKQNSDNTERERFTSLKQLQERIPSILKEHGNDDALNLAALANPILALEHLGYSFSPAARIDIAKHIRFGKKVSTKLKSLRKEVYEFTGDKFDLDDPEELSKELNQLLNEEAPQSRGAKKTKKSNRKRFKPKDVVPPNPEVRWGPKFSDPLERYADKHPVFEPLLKYRRLDASQPRLASERDFNAVLRGKVKLPATRARLVLQSEREG